MELFAEAELDTGNAVCWWLDVRWDGGRWVLEPAVLIQHAGGQDNLVEIPAREAEDEDAMTRLLPSVAEELLANQERDVYAALAWPQPDA